MNPKSVKKKKKKKGPELPEEVKMLNKTNVTGAKRGLQPGVDL